MTTSHETTSGAGQGLPSGQHDDAWRERALLCRWFSTLLARELDDATLAAYFAGEAVPLLEALGAEGVPQPLVERFEHALNALRLFEQPRLELAADFATLFLLDGRASAPPYASLYQGERALFHQQSTERMEKRLAAAGYQVQDEFGEPADHLAIMLDYLAAGLERLVEAPPAKTRETRDGLAQFVDEELAPWLPIFAARCQQVDTASDFYPCVVNLIQAYCAMLMVRLTSATTD